MTLALCLRDNDTVRATATSAAAAAAAVVVVLEPELEVEVEVMTGFKAIGLTLAAGAGGTVFSRPWRDEGRVAERSLGVVRTEMDVERGGRLRLLSVLARLGRVGIMPACSILLTVLLAAYLERGMNLASFFGTGGGLSSESLLLLAGGSACGLVAVGAGAGVLRVGLGGP